MTRSLRPSPMVDLLDRMVWLLSTCDPSLRESVAWSGGLINGRQFLTVTYQPYVSDYNVDADSGGAVRYTLCVTKKGHVDLSGLGSPFQPTL